MLCRIPAVGFPALVAGHHLSGAASSRTVPVKSGSSSNGKRGRQRPKEGGGSKRARK